MWIIIDFKLTFEAKYSRNKTPELYGKKLKWHGDLSYSLCTIAQNEKADMHNRELNKFQISCCNHILTSDNKRDRFAAWSYFEAEFISIKKHLWHLNRFYVQFKNVYCYRNIALLMDMANVESKYGLELKMFIHTGTPDGNSSQDGHFAKKECVW